MNVVQTLNNKNNIPHTKLYVPYVACASHLWQDNVRMTYHRSVFVQPLLQWKSESITYSECVCSLGYPAHKAHAPHYIFTCGLPWCIKFFPTLPHTQHNIWKNVTEHEKSILIFPTVIVWNIPNSKKHSAKISSEMYICLHVKYPLFLSDFNETWSGTWR